VEYFPLFIEKILYPLIPDPEFKDKKVVVQADWLKEHATDDIPPGYLMPVAYLWTRTVICKNPNCKATVPLVKQTWLCKQEKRYVALKVIAPHGKTQVRFQVVEAHSQNGLGFDPTDFSKRGNATCPFCGTVADSDHVKAEGCAGRIKQQMMAIVCTHPGKQGKAYLAADDLPNFLPDEDAIRKRIEKLCTKTGLTIPGEPIEANPRSMDTHLFGFNAWADLYTSRQLVSLLSFAASVRNAHAEMHKMHLGHAHAIAIATLCGCVVDKQADFNSSLCVLKADGGRGIVHTFGRHALPMVWDFAEANPFNEEIACWTGSLKEVVANLEDLAIGGESRVQRGSATSLPWGDNSFEAVVTDPPYYDNVSYSNLSDFFYVWLKRSVGYLYPEHFAAVATPKKNELIAAYYRHSGSKASARAFYESQMVLALREAHRVLRNAGQLVMVYAHKTTLGWSTLVDALKQAGFIVTEAWPVDTETSGRLIAQETAALASSIFLIARKRDGEATGNYEEAVQPELEQIVRERVATLWAMGISGADLVIACVGAGLRAFTRFTRVEYANGEEVPAERFLAEVETVVLETILARLSKEVGGNGSRYSLAGLDPATRFYVLWRYTYKAVDLDAGEAIIFANGTHVELDGPHGLSTGSHNLIEKKKGKYRLLDFSERGDDKHLGMPADDGQPAPLVDALHRTLWLLEKHPTQLSEFLRESQINREQLRLVAQALAGPALKGGELADVSPSAELSALAKLTANWQSVVEDAALTVAEKEDRKTGQKRFNI